ncbi:MULTISPECIES: hypothetical protein [Burkholderia]|uniref:OmpA-like domain-containing protein n=1 Tax=Burkholderia sola TaxID=2843302 RepID=A0ABV2C670_9BURK|nr:MULTISPECIES: hypothetical protein [unclassified Burkholderia]CAG2345694.1 hypothetical protein BCCR75389_05357 [Burkholderia cenocepacia]MBP0606686.1 hypothetical protein [Burkholderia sp. CpTa8-5]QRR15426.1 hypothetical protein GJG85_18565 [Burkholderia sp. MS389]QVN15891.1 hypothetical protein JYG37_29325 [Burkholderia sp. LAS2]CAG2345916.1 hypothetical protein BCCR75388_05384 [Burkholderia cenocepacia]
MRVHIKAVFSGISRVIALSACAGIFPAHACTIGESVRIPLPLNSVDVTNADRLKIANAVIEARKWPDAEIQAVVISGAYTTERNRERLKTERAKIASEYLKQLGIRNEHIIIDKKTFTDAMVRNSDGTLTLYQIDIELTPLCRGGCQRLCDDPRVTPRSKAIL